MSTAAPTFAGPNADPLGTIAAPPLTPTARRAMLGSVLAVSLIAHGGVILLLLATDRRQSFAATKDHAISVELVTEAPGNSKAPRDSKAPGDPKAGGATKSGDPAAGKAATTTAGTSGGTKDAANPGAAQESAKLEATKSEPAKTAAAKPELAKSEAAKSADSKPEPAKPEPAAKSELAKPQSEAETLKQAAPAEVANPTPTPKPPPQAKARAQALAPRPPLASPPQAAPAAPQALAAASPGPSTAFGPLPGSFNAVVLPSTTIGGQEAVSYKALVFSQIAKAKRFPAAARARGASGVAVVSFTVDDAGDPMGVKLARSSGDPDIDAEIVAMVGRAAPFPPPPQGAQRSFSAAIEFGQDE